MTPAREDEQRPSANSTADRAIEILLAFSEVRPLWTAAGLAKHFSMPRSTIYRYLGSLRAQGLIADDEKGGLRLGARVIALARVAKSSASIVATAAPLLKDLNDRFGEVVTLSERVGHEIVPLERLECRHALRITFMRGEMLPWPATAAAKALLAFAPRDEADALFGLFTPTRYTPTTIASVGELRKELATIRKQGFSVSNEERDDGVRGIAAPVVRAGEARYCVTIGGPASRLTDRRLKEMRPALVDVAGAIAAELDGIDF